VSTHLESGSGLEGVQARPPAGWRVLAPFRFREYRLLIAAISLSIFAHGMWAVVMAFQVMALDHDPATLSLVATCMSAGLVGFVLVGGIAADRISQRTIIIAVESVNCAVVGVITTMGLMGQLRIWHMAVAAALLGVGAGFFFPAYSAYLPRILPPQQLLAANGVEGVVRPVLQRAVGPAVAGVAVGATFPSVGAIAVAVSFAVGLLLLLATKQVTHDSPGEAALRERHNVLADLRAGFWFMARTPWLLATVLFASIFVLVVLGPIEVLLPFIATERFDDGARMYGLLLAAYGVGGALGALGISSVRLPRRYLTIMMAMWGVGTLFLTVVGCTDSFALMASALFVVGVTDGAGMVIWGTLLQRRVPAEMLGRVSSLDFFVSLAFMPVSMAIAGPVSKVVSMQAIFLVAGVVPIVLAVIAWFAARMGRDEIAHPL
jgi:MFS transporter, DHA3 family, tetracycline resistance protein